MRLVSPSFPVAVPVAVPVPALPAAGPPVCRAAFWLALPLLALALHALPARADQALWELGLGLGGVRLPHYRGSDQAHTLVLPVPLAIYRGKIFRATREGARAVLLDSERFEVDISVAASAPTQSEDNRARRGMPDLAGTLELGPNLNLTLARGPAWKMDLRLPARAVVSLQSRPQDLGWTLSPVLNLDMQHAGWNIGVQGGPLFGSRRHHAYFYDVAPVYATGSRAAYTAKGGYGGWRLTTGVSRRFGSMWVGGFLRTDSVARAAFEPSPLVRQRMHLSFGLAVSWVLATSAERVSLDD